MLTCSSLLPQTAVPVEQHGLQEYRPAGCDLFAENHANLEPAIIAPFLGPEPMSECGTLDFMREFEGFFDLEVLNAERSRHEKLISKALKLRVGSKRRTERGDAIIAPQMLAPHVDGTSFFLTTQVSSVKKSAPQSVALSPASVWKAPLPQSARTHLPHHLRPSRVCRSL